MGRVSQHYERSFEAFLTERRVPHVMVDDARRAILPRGAKLGCTDSVGVDVKIKSFDSVVYGADRNLLVEVKGRRVDLRRGGSGRRESWTTIEDVRSLGAWERLFGPPFEGVLLFWYWLDGPVLNALEREVFRFEGRAYTHRAVRLSDYTRLMSVRSPKWGTVNLSAMDLEAVWMPLLQLMKSGARPGAGRSGRAADVEQAIGNPEPGSVASGAASA